MSSTCILLIDDHAMFRAGIRMILDAGLSDISIVEAGTLHEGVGNRKIKPDVVLLDLKLPGLNGVDGIEIIKRRWPQVAIFILSSQDDAETKKIALERGAVRFISKAEVAEEIVRSILSLTHPHKAPTPAPTHSVSPAPHLTARQCEVLDLLSLGMSNKLIARQLFLSENTVRVHVQAILAFLEVSSRTEAACVARKKGLIG